jgi:hypothetical protein
MMTPEYDDVVPTATQVAADGQETPVSSEIGAEYVPVTFQPEALAPVAVVVVDACVVGVVVGVPVLPVFPVLPVLPVLPVFPMFFRMLATACFWAAVGAGAPPQAARTSPINRATTLIRLVMVGGITTTGKGE